jgi:hypothetical protein
LSYTAPATAPFLYSVLQILFSVTFSNQRCICITYFHYACYAAE